MRSRLAMCLAGAMLPVLFLAGPVAAQIQIRIGDPARVTYSELHEGLRAGTPAADSALRILKSTSRRNLWRQVSRAARGQGPWNDGLLALTLSAGLMAAAAIGWWPATSGTPAERPS